MEIQELRQAYSRLAADAKRLRLQTIELSALRDELRAFQADLERVTAQLRALRQQTAELETEAESLALQICRWEQDNVPTQPFNRIPEKG